MEAAQAGESNPPPPGSPQPLKPCSNPCPRAGCERRVLSSLPTLHKELQRVFISQREHPHTSRSCVEGFLAQLLPFCPSLATGRSLQGPQGAEMSQMAPGGMRPLQPGAWQAVPSPWRDAATQRGCPHSLRACPSSARQTFGCAHSHY